MPTDLEFLELCDIKDVIINGNITAVKYCVERLHMNTNGGISLALQLNKTDVAHYLLAEGSHYDPYELDYCHSPQSVKLALVIGWEITSTGIKYMSNKSTGSLTTLKVLLRDYGSSAAQVVVSKYKDSDDECLAHILGTYNVKVNRQMIEYLCESNMAQSLKVIANKVNIINYIHCISICNASLIDYFLRRLNLHVSDLPFYSLFKHNTDDIVYNKLVKYSDMIPDFAMQADQVCLLDEYLDEDHIECAIYVINKYNLAYSGKSREDTCTDILASLWNEFEETPCSELELREFLCAICEIFPRLDMSEFTHKYSTCDDVSNIGKDFSKALITAKYNI